MFRQVHASTTVPVGLLKKGGKGPALFHVMFPTVEGAAAFCDAIDKTALPPALLAALNNLLDGETFMLCYVILYYKS